MAPTKKRKKAAKTRTRAAKAVRPEAPDPGKSEGTETEGTEIPRTWQVGDIEYIHDGFAAYELDQLNSPKTIVGRYKDAVQAVTAAEKLGRDYAAFSLYISKTGARLPLRVIVRDDLPITIGPPQSKQTADASRDGGRR